MGPCRICRATEVHASHRRGWFERGPLTWAWILPYRCGHCHARFYRFGWRDPRRRHAYLEDPTVAQVRAPRWSFRARARLTVHPGGRPPLTLSGRTENLSVRGARVRLPEGVPPGTRVRLSLPGERPRAAVVRWSKTDGPGEVVHGVELDVSLERGNMSPPAVRRLRRRRLVRRVGLGVLALAIIAGTSAGLVWVMEHFRTYKPTYYEPKDVEREQYEMQRMTGAPPHTSERR